MLSETNADRKVQPLTNVPTDVLLEKISNDSPTDLPQSWLGTQQGLWHGAELFGNGRKQTAAPSQTNGMHTNGSGGPSIVASNGVPGGCSMETMGRKSAGSKSGVQPLPGGKPDMPLHSGLSALARSPTPPPQLPQAQAQMHALHHKQFRVQQTAPAQNNAAAPGTTISHAQLALNPMLQQQAIARMQQQHKETTAKLQSTLQQQQNNLQQQLKALKGRDEELAKLQKTLREREEEISRLNSAQQKLQKAKDSELASLRGALQKEKEDKLVKLNAAHNKRIAAKEEEIALLRMQMTKEKEKEIAKLISAHQKQLKVKVDELLQTRSELTREKDDQFAHLTNSNKELKNALMVKEQEAASVRKQLSTMHKAEELRKQQKDETQTKEAIAKMRGSIEQAHDEEVRKLAEDHEQVLSAKNREMANLTAQLKQVLQRYQQTQTSLQRERDKVKEALLDSRNMAEVAMQYSGEQEERLLTKVKKHVQDCSVEEVHWLMTKTFRSWLSQSYTECDEVSNALEAEQQRLKRISYSKEQELGKMRARVGHLQVRIAWVCQVCGLSMIASLATGFVGSWRAIMTGHFWSSIQLMALAWLVVFATALVVLFSDGCLPVAPLPLATTVRQGEPRQTRHAMGSMASRHMDDQSRG
mmetsp:Transcript_41167/g.68455  ORF Transcript_41167/g.68455 Transcript_41167/m.68455 type:complete len:643 (-) Transcript_41167:259-2187(-)